MRRFVAGLVAGILLMVSVPALASSIDVAMDSINLFVNGTKVNEPNIVWNGRTYVQLRAIGEMLGKEIKWNAATKTAEVNDKGTDTEAVTPDANTETYYPLTTSRSAPAAVKEVVKLQFGSKGDESIAVLTLKEVIRGDAALSMLKAASPYASTPKDGHEYILAKIDFKLLKNKDKLHLYYHDFYCISSAGKEYESASAAYSIEPNIKADLYEGGSNEGYTLVEVSKTDTQPVLTFGRDYSGAGGAWFKLY